MGMISEFKEFALKGNMVDMAVGIIIGAAFGTVISSLVADVLMPVVSSIAGAPDFSEMYTVLREPTDAMEGEGLEAFRNAGGVALAYGKFINAIISFLLVAIALFFVIKGMNKAKKAEPEPEPAPAGPTQEELLAEIRDLLKK